MNPVQPFISPARRAELENPYVVAGPVLDRRLFVGRDDLLRHVNGLIAGQSARRPLVVYGPSAVGKTSILKQLESGIVAGAATAVLVDLARLSVDSLASFTWDAANAIGQSLRQRRLFWLEPPRLKRSAFLEDPGHAFAHHLMQPLSENAGAPLLLLLDNVELLAESDHRQLLGEPFLRCLHPIIQRQANLFPVLAVKGSTLPLLALLGNPHYHLVGPLDYEATAALLRRPVPYRVFHDICRHIWQITNGQPRAVQQLAHALFNRWQQQRLGYITFTDIREVLRHELPELSGKLADPS